MMKNVIDKLSELNYVYMIGGKVNFGTKYPLPCRLEGFRKNEIVDQKKEYYVEPFWISKYCVRNSEYEEYDVNHHRPPTSLGDNDPVVDVTYLDAMLYAGWLSNKHGLNFVLPTELQWLLSASPFGWSYPYKKGPKPISKMAHTFDPSNYKTQRVDDERFVNKFGLVHMGGNVMEITKDWYYTAGHFGSNTDGAYYIAKGGDFGHCPFSAGVARRAIIDVSDRSSRVGFRLVCIV